MQSSKISDRFPKLFVDMLDDMITESTSENEKDLLDDLLTLFYDRVKDCRQYYKSSVDTCDYYLMQIDAAKYKQTQSWDRYDEICKALKDDIIPPDYC